MNVIDAIKSRRTVRKFKQKPVNEADLRTIIDCGRLAPTGANLQPLKFTYVTDENIRKEMYPHLKYAGYTPDWDPSFDECATAFIIIMNDTNIKPTEKSECDSGAAIMNMSLAATELGLDTCWLGSVDRLKIKELLSLPNHLDITYVLAVGYADQSGEYFDSSDTIKYYFDEKDNVHVPKRPLDEVIL
ncbi:MAG: nitroreductase family protein [Eubacteriales bacterium]|nr:nitroreductase family protein [Eubacteriales bacterium]